ncbi:hypothetical protein ACFYVL_02825 [Streptomyces sp. NPDC004111]|uniref:hypothetical protein n=1 Tax=Streptomyces sp. NPDC004111 TaxID=3364690 RepID=UPI0036BE4C0E
MARSHPFPADLIQLQRDWTAAYELLAQDPTRTALRRRLRRLSVRIERHPHWTAADGRTRTTRPDLRREARAEAERDAR